jgi:uncharacterized membrane protein YdjX (TVP38/TMEM64 family)
VRAEFVSPQYFSILGVAPRAGRLLDAGDRGPSPVPVVISERWWQTATAADPAVINRAVVVTDTPAVIVGVVREFRGLTTERPADLFLPLESTATVEPAAAATMVRLAMRLHPGVTTAVAEQKIAVLYKALGPSMARRIARFGAELGALVALAALWRWTPLREIVSPSAISPTLALLAFPVAGLLGVPVTPLVILTCFLFGPLAGGLYALAGALISAALTYAAGRLLGRAVVRRIAGSRLNAITLRLARKGVWAVAALRLLPIAGYSTVNLVSGASRVPFAELMLGTALGMMPWILLTLTFVDRVRAVLREPGAVSYALLAADVVLILAAVVYVRRKFGGSA